MWEELILFLLLLNVFLVNLGIYVPIKKWLNLLNTHLTKAKLYLPTQDHKKVLINY